MGGIDSSSIVCMPVALASLQSGGMHQPEMTKSLVQVTPTRTSSTTNAMIRVSLTLAPATLASLTLVPTTLVPMTLMPTTLVPMTLMPVTCTGNNHQCNDTRITYASVGDTCSDDTSVDNTAQMPLPPLVGAWMYQAVSGVAAAVAS